VRELTPKQKASLPWLKAWAQDFRRLYDDFERIVKKDPMMLYNPGIKASREFHKSLALTRYYRAGNRSRKTTSGYAENYFAVTGHHPYRPMPSYPASTVIVAGLPFTDYAPRVFERKLLYGEDGNVLSPMFPEGGKWFYHYNKQQHILTLACPECAEAGKAGSCPGHHKKATIALVSSEKGVGVIEAFTVRLFHIDEHVPEEFYHAGKMRVADQPGGNLIVTGTPLHGLEAWEKVKLSDVAEGPKKLNRREDGSPLVSLHTCTMYEGKIVPKSMIEDMKQGMDEFEVESRIYGIPAPLAKNPVFDRTILAELRKDADDPLQGTLICTKPLIEADEETKVIFGAVPEGPVNVWEAPKAGAQYVIGVDSAAGLSDKHDASCASVLKLSNKDGRMHFDLVAQYHNRINPLDYGDEVFKLALWYNSAQVIIELTGGLGRAVALRLSRELAYWNIFRDTTKPEFAEFGQDARFGVDTNATTKPFMVSALQQVLKKRLINIRCKHTIQEMVAFEQERTSASGQALMVPRYRGAGGAHDDRVMSLVIAVSVAISQPIYDFSQTEEAEVVEDTGYSPEWAAIHKDLDNQRVEPL
jgi:hypothetical protein